jgi:hypothetical protein
MDKKLETISIENNNYHIFKVESKEGLLEIYFIWGKTDFLCSWKKQGENWEKKKIQIYKNSQWYDYQKVSHHGVALDESYWKNDHDDLFIDLPKNFSGVVNKIYEKIIQDYFI